MPDAGRSHAFRYGGEAPRPRARRREPLTLLTEDCFCGRLTATDGRPRELAQYPFVNPLTGPIAVEGVRPGDLLAIHLAELAPARDWGVATLSPDFGALSGTAVEGAPRTTLIFDVAEARDAIPWPRLDTDGEIGVVGCARPLEDAVRIAATALVRWVADLAGLPLADAHQRVSQVARLRVGNLVNPLYTVAAFVPKGDVPGRPAPFGGTHGRLRALAAATP